MSKESTSRELKLRRKVGDMGRERTGSVPVFFCHVRAMRLTLECKVAVAEWSNMDNAQLRDVLEKGQVLFQEEFAQVIVIVCREPRFVETPSSSDSSLAPLIFQDACALTALGRLLKAGAQVPSATKL